MYKRQVDLPLLEAVFGTLPLTPPLPPPTLLTFKPAHTGPVRQTWPGKMQSSLRLGRLGPNRSHPDYFAVLVANEVFGGYFGSRLMKNIREEKGYTYGIYSQLTHLQQASYWSIGTDVNREVAEATMNEIGREMALMQQHPVEETELSTAKNYMIGQFAGSLNTPFEIADRHKTRLLAGLPADYYEHFVENVRAVTPEQVQEAARRYLGVENWQQIAIG